MMIEGNARQITEERFMEALEFGQRPIQPMTAAQTKSVEMVGKRKKQFELALPKK
jgi:polyribonucleotide nucleotidyltransferase